MCIRDSSGADHGQHTTDLQFIELIEKNNKVPFLRNTLYTETKNLSEDILSKDVIKL